MLGRRPAATSSRSARSSRSVPPSSVSATVNVPSAWRTDVIDAPASTWTPSAANASATTRDASGSSGERMRGAASSTETEVPNLANAWASSAPMAPPPMTIMLSGSSGVAKTSRLVQ